MASMNGSPTPPDLVERIRDLRYIDGFTCQEVARELGVNVHTVRHLAPGRPGKVPTAPMREAFLQSGLTACEVATRLGWMSSRGPDRRGPVPRPRPPHGDSSRVLRTLGLRPDISGTSGGRSFRLLMDAEVAQNIAEACGVAGWSVLPDETAVAA